MSGEGFGVPWLLQSLSVMLGESVYLWYTPPPAGDDIRWRVWSGSPYGSTGGEVGRGRTADGALQEAYHSAVRRLFDRDPEVSA